MEAVEEAGVSSQRERFLCATLAVVAWEAVSSTSSSHALLGSLLEEVAGVAFMSQRLLRPACMGVPGAAEKRGVTSPSVLGGRDDP